MKFTDDCIQLLSLYQLPLSLISVTVNTVTMICTGFCHSQEDYQVIHTIIVMHVLYSNYDQHYYVQILNA